MSKFSTLLLLISLVACSSVSSSKTWDRYTFDLSGHVFSVSAPPGHFRDVYVSKVDLATNEKAYLTLLEKAWVFSGVLADQGGMDFIVALHRAELGVSEEDFLRGVQKDVSDAFRRISPNGVPLGNVTRRKLGGREWHCFPLLCALKLDSRHYISWRLKDINNVSSKISARDQLRKSIEDSLEITF